MSQIVATAIAVAITLTTVATDVARSAPEPTAATPSVDLVPSARASASAPEQSKAAATPRRTPAPRPARDAREGRASWYDDGAGLYAAVHSFRWGDVRYRVRVWYGKRYVDVTVRDHCACYTGTSKERLIDLSPAAFRALAPLGRGIINVRVEGLR